jgi:hypothetical protein
MPNRYPHHRCRAPQRHHLITRALRTLWLGGGALWLVPRLVYAWTHSGAWAFVSIGLALTVGSVMVKGLAEWRCQSQPRTWDLSPLMHTALLAWTLRREP